MFLLPRYNRLIQSRSQILNIQSLRNPFLKCHSPTNPTYPFAEYLQKSCGMSPEQALKASKSVSHKTGTRNIASVVLFLKSQGFSETHIKSVICSRPSILNYAAPDSRISPKIDFFTEKGLSQPEVVDLMVLNPIFLTSSLEEWIKPKFGFIKSILGTDELVIEWLKHRKLFYPDWLQVNVITLKDYGIPRHLLAKLLFKQTMALELEPNRFKEKVKMVKEMGFNPSTFMFLAAVTVMTSLSRAVWEEKLNAYKSYGWSDDQILSTFRSYPFFLLLSKEKIRRAMDFFVKELGWTPLYISSYPCLLNLSLEKRIMPRNKFLQILVSKGLITADKKASRFILSNKLFFENYVVKYQETFPEILKVYEDIIGSKKKV